MPSGDELAVTIAPVDLVAELISLVAPPRCLSCRAPDADPRAGLCQACRNELPWLPAGRCARCSLGGHLAGCPARGGALSRTWAPLAYEGVARRLVHELKFRGRLALAETMAAHLAANLPPDLRRSGAVVVPVPAHAGRRRQRGHDPVDALAAGFARRTGLSLSRCLRRTDSASRQLGATHAQRTAAGRIGIAVAADRVAPHVLLVDDVHTTGATLEACAGVLRTRGAVWVAGVAYARAR